MDFLDQKKYVFHYLLLTIDIAPCYAVVKKYIKKNILDA